MHQIITTAEKAMEIGVFAAQPGNFLVDFFPASKKVLLSYGKVY